MYNMHMKGVMLSNILYCSSRKTAEYLQLHGSNKLACNMLMRHIQRRQLAQLCSSPAAACSLMTAAPVQATAVVDLPRSRDRETADEETFKRPFYCIKTNELPPWPRTTGMTEVRGPFSDVVGKRRLWDLFETVGPAIDGIKFVGGSPHVLTRSAVVELIEIAHTRFVYVCESGLLQHALAQGPKTVRRYVQECRDLHFDAVELPDACADMLPDRDYLLLLDDLHALISWERKFLTCSAQAGLKPKPKIGIWHAGGAAKDHGYLRERAFDRGAMATATDAILKAKLCLERGAEQITVDSLALPGEHAGKWQDQIVRRLVDELGLGKLMFEAPDPEVFSWFVDKIGPEVNLHVDFTQVVHLQCLRRGVLYPPPVSLAYTGMPPADDDTDTD